MLSMGPTVECKPAKFVTCVNSYLVLVGSWGILPTSLRVITSSPSFLPSWGILPTSLGDVTPVQLLPP